VLYAGAAGAWLQEQVEDCGDDLGGEGRSNEEPAPPLLLLLVLAVAPCSRAPVTCGGAPSTNDDCC
jgi:hypothetical protein